MLQFLFLEYIVHFTDTKEHFLLRLILLVLLQTSHDVSTVNKLTSVTVLSPALFLDKINKFSRHKSYVRNIVYEKHHETCLFSQVSSANTQHN